LQGVAVRYLARKWPALWKNACILPPRHPVSCLSSIA